MPNRKNTRRTPLTSRWMWLTLVPLYLFTLVLVLGPLVYMLVLSFETRADMWGVIPQFTLANYQNIFQPVYLNTFVQSLKLARTLELLNQIGKQRQIIYFTCRR